MNSNIADVSEATTETGKSAGEVLETAKELMGQSDALKERIGAFLDEVKAA